MQSCSIIAYRRPALRQRDSRLGTVDSRVRGNDRLEAYSIVWKDFAIFLATKGVLLTVCVALFFGVLNASAVGVVLPDIAADMSVDTGQLGWLMTGFLLVYGIAIPLYGRLADRCGARPIFLLGVAVFSTGSLLCAMAPTFP